MAQQDEQTLIQQAQKGQLDAFNQLVLLYQDPLYTVAFRLMGDSAAAMDMTQEALITAYQKIGSYAGGNFGAWLRRIVTNRCYDELRKNKRHRTTSLDDMGLGDDGIILPDNSPSPERVAQDNELQQALQDCIQSLNPDQRLILVLSDVQGMAYQEVSEQTGVALGTVKSRLSRARLAMRQCLMQFEELLPAEFRLFTKPNT